MGARRRHRTIWLAAAVLLLAALGGCEWLKLRIDGSERGIDWGISLPL